MSRRPPPTGVFYSYLAVGSGRGRSLAGGLVAVASDHAFQICLYRLLGASLTRLWPAAHLAWWPRAIIAWALVRGLGVLPSNINAPVPATLLMGEIGTKVPIDIGASTDPAGSHLPLSGSVQPTMLFVAAVSGDLGRHCRVGGI